ncbi:hypothetical protein FH969_01365 [Miniimonas arenae]|uniref:Uncharacterized protein n=1 Tax=Miniimonas arenae TaxID=676201 RepID=A0A5C5BFQ2_9MICO|nr:hypothetical protein [Miniimonas arenae]TNU77022.1 hypothetical protein FH969_01365 [Miniimonas arenae]
MTMLAVAGCVPFGGDGDGGGQGDGDPTAASAPTAHRSIPPGFIECDGRPPKDGELVADVDLTTLTAPDPPRFHEASGYYEDNPVEGDWTARYWVPDDQQASLDVINLLVYPQMDLGPLTVTCDMISWRDITDRIATYHEINGAEVIEETTQTSVAGLPAVREVVDLPGSGYSYLGYWIFGRGQVAHLYCQWVDDEATIVAGCEDFIGSVTVS